MTSLDQHLTDFLSQWGWTAEAIARLCFASIAGGLIGLERELRGREAGFRTNLLVCLGSSLVMIVSLRIPMSDHWTEHGAGLNIVSDPARIAYGVMTGIGFLGAGAIIRDRGTVRGVTTAASLWCVTAIGLGLGSGVYTLCLAATTMVVLVLWLLEYVQEKLPRAHYRLITVRRRWEPKCILDTIKHVEQAGLRVMDMNFRRSEDLASADIELRTVFYSKREYYELERDLERDHTYKLISIQES